MNTSNEVTRYIESFPEPVYEKLVQIRTLIRELLKEVNQVEECMRYGIPTYRVGKNIVHFAGYESHIGFYPTPSGVEYFKSEISEYKHSKGAIQFPIDSPLPVDLIRKITEFRLKEVLREGC